MTSDETLSVLSRILRDLLGVESITLQAATRRGDVEGWDSFMYVNFIVSVEVEFGIKFSVADVEAFETVGEILDEVLRLTAKN